MFAITECAEGTAMDVRIREYVRACLLTAVNNRRLITWEVPLPSAQGSRVHGLATASSDLDLYVFIEGSDVIGRETSVLLGFQAALLAKGCIMGQADSWCDTSYHTSWKDVETNIAVSLKLEHCAADTDAQLKVSDAIAFVCQCGRIQGRDTRGTEHAAIAWPLESPRWSRTSASADRVFCVASHRFEDKES